MSNLISKKTASSPKVNGLKKLSKSANIQQNQVVPGVAETTSQAPNFRPDSKTWPTWSCQIESLKLAPTSGALSGGVGAAAPTSSQSPITVGDKLLLNCEGDFVEKPTAKLKIEFDSPAQNWSLYLLDQQVFRGQSAQFIVTSYKPGTYKDIHFYLTYGQKGIRIMPMSWNVQSVIKTQRKEPFPSYGPFSLKMPMWVWGAAGILGASLLALLIFRYRKYRQKKEVLEEIRKLGLSLSPFQQFNKDLRLLLRNFSKRSFDEKVQKDFIEKSFLLRLDHLFRQYVMREFLLPSFKWSDETLIKEIQKENLKLFKSCGSGVQKIFRELSVGRSNEKNLTEHDLEQIAKLCQKSCSDIENYKRKGAQ